LVGVPVAIVVGFRVLIVVGDAAAVVEVVVVAGRLDSGDSSWSAVLSALWYCATLDRALLLWGAEGGFIRVPGKG